MDKTNLFMANVGPVNDVNNASGTPFFLYSAMNGEGERCQDLKLNIAKNYARDKILWNIKSLICSGKYGGYQFSDSFLNRLWRDIPKSFLDGATLLNFFQLYPRWVNEYSSIKKWFYIDQTLKQCDAYFDRSIVNADILNRERLGYESATGVIVHSEWAARSLIDDYRIKRSKIYVETPAANVLRLPSIKKKYFDGSQLKLVFLGKDYRRKGLDRLLGGLRIATSRGANISLTVIGCELNSDLKILADGLGVSWIGYIDKSTHFEIFESAIKNSHIGCLLSRSEAGGMSLREFIAYGLGVIAPRVGGAPEHTIGPASMFVDPGDTDLQIGDLLFGLWANPDHVNEMMRHAFEGANSVSWSEVAKRLSRIIRD